NGDLTDPGESLPNDGTDFSPFEVKVGPDRYKVTSLQLLRHPTDGVMLTVSVDIAGKYKQYCAATLGTDRQKAPIAHFHGPLQARLREARGGPSDKLVPGDKPSDLCALVGTIDEANGCWVVVESTNFQADAHPEVVVTFPPKELGGESI